MKTKKQILLLSVFFLLLFGIMACARGPYGMHDRYHHDSDHGGYHMMGGYDYDMHDGYDWRYRNHHQ
jgi:hypothetical protein